MSSNASPNKASEAKLKQSDMKDRSPKWPDASSGTQKGPMVSEGATRDSVAKTPATIGRTG